MLSVGLDEPSPQVPNTPIALRTNFDALAEFAPSVKTDADGIARVPVTLPDNLTRYRIVAVAVAGAKANRKRRSRTHSTTAAHGTTLCTTVPELWR